MWKEHKNTTYVKEGDIVRVHNEEFGEFDVGCPFNETCKIIVVTGRMNSDDLKEMCLCSSQCETLDLSNVHVTAETILPMWCFVDAYNLKSVKLPSGLLNIGDCTFCNCGCLESVFLPDNLQTIGRGSFQNCPKLEMVVPSTVSIGENSFLGSSRVSVNVDGLQSHQSICPMISSLLSWIGL